MLVVVSSRCQGQANLIWYATVSLDTDQDEVHTNVDEGYRVGYGGFSWDFCPYLYILRLVIGVECGLCGDFRACILTGKRLVTNKGMASSIDDTHVWVGV